MLCSTQDFVDNKRRRNNSPRNIIARDQKWSQITFSPDAFYDVETTRLRKALRGMLHAILTKCHEELTSLQRVETYSAIPELTPF